MIDYEKLKEAEEICTASSNLCFEITLGMTNSEICLYDTVSKKSPFFFKSTRALLDHLKAKPPNPPAFGVGERVWLVAENELTKLTIYDLTFDEEFGEYVYYFKEGGHPEHPESELYDSRESLIEAQIQHWTSLKNKETSTGSENVSTKPKCEHVGDALVYVAPLTIPKCIKCGELYK